MIYSITSQKDATIYSDIKDLNTGLDEILEIKKSKYQLLEGGQEILSNNFFLSRILVQFDLNKIPSGLVNPQYFLKLYSTETKESRISYELKATLLSRSWDNGYGSKFSSPKITEGVTWLTSSSDNGIGWNNLGGDTGSIVCSQSFNFETADINMDVTSIVNSWTNNTNTNYGFLIYFSSSIENNTIDYGRLNFYSKETNTIYQPLLQIKWNDFSFSTGSLSSLNLSSDIEIFIKNIKTEYKQLEKVRFNVFCRERFPSKVFSSTPRYLNVQYLPTSSYYSIQDAHTEEVIVPFDDTYTKISCTSSGNYFDFWFNGLHPERYYKILLKVNDENKTSRIFDNKYIFKIVR